MVKHRITMGLPYHPRTRALIDGEIGIDGYELDITHEPSAGERHYRFAQGEWDVGDIRQPLFFGPVKGFCYVALPIFFERGIYPIIHLIALKQDVAERYPDLPNKLLEAFREAKKLSTKNLSPEQIEGHEREKAALGEDPYAYVPGETEKRSRFGWLSDRTRAFETGTAGGKFVCPAGARSVIAPW